MKPPTEDTDRFALMRERLYTPVVGDVLDALGCFHQFLPQPVQPMRESMKIAGRTMPALMIDVHGEQKRPWGKLTEALDDLETWWCQRGRQLFDEERTGGSKMDWDAIENQCASHGLFWRTRRHRARGRVAHLTGCQIHYRGHPASGRRGFHRLLKISASPTSMAALSVTGLAVARVAWAWKA